MKVLVEKSATFAGHKDCIYTLEKGGEPHIFFSAAGDGMVVKWDLQTPDLGALVVKVPSSIYAICFVEEFNHLIVGQNFEGIHIIDLNNNKEIKSLKLSRQSIFDIKIIEGKIFVAGGDGYITIIDYNTLTILSRLKYSDKSARSISINYRCGEFAVGFSDHYIRIFDLKDYKLKYEFPAHDNSVFAVAYSQDSQFLLSGSRDAKIKRWDVLNGYTIDETVVAHMYAINHIAFSAEGENFVTCSLDKSIKVWNTKEMKLLKVIDRARYAGHGTSINKLLWTNYDNQVISCSDDKMISVWKIKWID